MSDTPNGNQEGESIEAAESAGPVTPGSDVAPDSAPDSGPDAGGDSQPAQEVEADARQLRLLEAILFSSAEPLTEDGIAERLPDGADVKGLLGALADHYENHGINLAHAGGRWLFRTAEDLSEELRVYKTVARKLSRAAMETLAIIAYHQPATRAEIEEIRGVGLSRGTLDLLLESGWIAPKGRRRTAGRPVTWGTTTGFLVEFGIESIKDLPGIDDLKAAGLLDTRPAMEISEFARSLDEEDECGEDDASDEEREEFDMPRSLSDGVDGETGVDAQNVAGSDNEGSAGPVEKDQIMGNDRIDGENAPRENKNPE
ncbi:MAG: SMC-Scp complex subunit ScpB [Alphaproteobacteria bacterium]|nr:SMC-Scp complex subunit ScpB [Alphaproteobacteria bacterium]